MSMSRCWCRRQGTCRAGQAARVHACMHAARRGAPYRAKPSSCSHASRGCTLLTSTYRRRSHLKPSTSSGEVMYLHPPKPGHALNCIALHGLGPRLGARMGSGPLHWAGRRGGGRWGGVKTQLPASLVQGAQEHGMMRAIRCMHMHGRLLQAGRQACSRPGSRIISYHGAPSAPLHDDRLIVNGDLLGRPAGSDPRVGQQHARMHGRSAATCGQASAT